MSKLTFVLVALGRLVAEFCLIKKAGVLVPPTPAPLFCKVPTTLIVSPPPPTGEGLCSSF